MMSMNEQLHEVFVVECAATNPDSTRTITSILGIFSDPDIAQEFRNEASKRMQDEQPLVMTYVYVCRWEVDHTTRSAEIPPQVAHRTVNIAGLNLSTVTTFCSADSE